MNNFIIEIISHFPFPIFHFHLLCYSLFQAKDISTKLVTERIIIEPTLIEREANAVVQCNLS